MSSKTQSTSCRVVGFFSGPSLAKPGGEVVHFKDTLIRETSLKRNLRKRDNRNIVRVIPVVKRRSYFFDS